MDNRVSTPQTTNISSIEPITQKKISTQTEKKEEKTVVKTPEIKVKSIDSTKVENIEKKVCSIPTKKTLSTRQTGKLPSRDSLKMSRELRSIMKKLSPENKEILQSLSDSEKLSPELLEGIKKLVKSSDQNICNQVLKTLSNPTNIEQGHNTCSAACVLYKLVSSNPTEYLDLVQKSLDAEEPDINLGIQNLINLSIKGSLENFDGLTGKEIASVMGDEWKAIGVDPQSSSGSFEAVLNTVKDGEEVPVNIGGHEIVLKGIDKDTVTFFNPSLAKEDTMSLDELKKSIRSAVLPVEKLNTVTQTEEELKLAETAKAGSRSSNFLELLDQVDRGDNRKKRLFKEILQNLDFVALKEIVMHEAKGGDTIDFIKNHATTEQKLKCLKVLIGKDTKIGWIGRNKESYKGAMKKILITLGVRSNIGIETAYQATQRLRKIPVEKLGDSLNSDRFSPNIMAFLVKINSGQIDTSHLEKCLDSMEDDLRFLLDTKKLHSKVLGALPELNHYQKSGLITNIAKGKINGRKIEQWSQGIQRSVEIIKSYEGNIGANQKRVIAELEKIVKIRAEMTRMAAPDVDPGEALEERNSRFEMDKKLVYYLELEECNVTFNGETKDIELLDIFNPGKKIWESLNREDRIKVLEQLSKLHSDTHEYKPKAGIIVKEPGQGGSGYKFGDINIGAKLIKSNDPIFVFRTLVHEATHAYQDAVVNNRCDVDPPVKSSVTDRLKYDFGFFEITQDTIREITSTVEKNIGHLLSGTTSELYLNFKQLEGQKFSTKQELEQALINGIDMLSSSHNEGFTPIKELILASSRNVSHYELTRDTTKEDWIEKTNEYTQNSHEKGAIESEWSTTQLLLTELSGGKKLATRLGEIKSEIGDETLGKRRMDEWSASLDYYKNMITESESRFCKVTEKLLEGVEKLCKDDYFESEGTDLKDLKNKFIIALKDSQLIGKGFSGKGLFNSTLVLDPPEEKQLLLLLVEIASKQELADNYSQAGYLAKTIGDEDASIVYESESELIIKRDELNSDIEKLKAQLKRLLDGE